MTVEELSGKLAQHPLLVVVVLAVPPVAAWALAKVHGKGAGGRVPWKYAYSVLVYCAAIPGMFACALTAYTMFFIRGNLLQANLLVYALPVVAMVVTLAVMRGSVEFDDIPGFDRLSGLMTMMGASFLIALIILKTHIRLLFFGSIWTFLGFVLALYLFMKWGAYMLLRKRDESEIDLPTFPEP